MVLRMAYKGDEIAHGHPVKGRLPEGILHVHRCGDQHVHPAQYAQAINAPNHLYAQGPYRKSAARLEAERSLLAAHH